MPQDSGTRSRDNTLRGARWRAGDRPVRAHHRDRLVLPVGEAGHERRTQRPREPGVLDRGQRLLPPANLRARPLNQAGLVQPRGLALFEHKFYCDAMSSPAIDLRMTQAAGLATHLAPSRWFTADPEATAVAELRDRKSVV